MMDVPLQLKALLWRAEHLYADKQIIARVGDGFHTYTYTDYGRRVRRLSNALARLGIVPGDRVGTLAWNTTHHLEAYFAVPCMGAVLHTINIRLSAEQIGFIVEHAADRVLLVSPDQLETLGLIRDRLGAVEAVVVMAEGPPPSTDLPVPVLGYEELLAGESDVHDYPDLDENMAASMCYTSGTTGHPKGVVYSQRSTVLHALMLCVRGSIGVDEHERYMLVTPLSHVNCWGMPFGCLLQGATIVLPGERPSAGDYLSTIEHSRATVFVGAVTVGMMMRRELDQQPRRFDISSLHTLWLGGQAPPVSEMEWWEETHSASVCQAWGMTEASPLLTFCGLASQHDNADDASRFAVLGRQGQPLPLVELKLVDDSGAELPWDGAQPGEVLARSPWVASSYYDDDRSEASFTDGWFRTGDIGVISPDGYLTVVDRAKDLIKSGGEWISSVDLENALIAHPRVREAAVVAAPDPKWLERPVAFVVVTEPVSAEELALYLRERLPSFWVPDRFEFIDEVPKTGVGKFDKKVLRSQYV